MKKHSTSAARWKVGYLSMIRKIASIYAIFIGIAIIGLWVILLFSGQVPELFNEPISISFHIAAEMVMAVLLIISGIGISSRKKWSVKLFTLSAGLVLYSVINSSGYYAQNGNILMVVLFMVLLILTVMISGLINRR